MEVGAGYWSWPTGSDGVVMEVYLRERREGKPALRRKNTLKEEVRRGTQHRDSQTRGRRLRLRLRVTTLEIIVLVLVQVISG